MLLTNSNSILKLNSGLSITEIARYLMLFLKILYTQSSINNIRYDLWMYLNV